MHHDIERVIQELRDRYPAIAVEQLKVRHTADDDGLWFFTHPAGTGEVQIESSTGAAPFLIESDQSPEQNLNCSVEDAVAHVARRLGLEPSIA
jgi:hypothetical protein